MMELSQTRASKNDGNTIRGRPSEASGSSSGAGGAWWNGRWQGFCAKSGRNVWDTEIDGASIHSSESWYRISAATTIEETKDFGAQEMLHNFPADS